MKKNSCHKTKLVSVVGIIFCDTFMKTYISSHSKEFCRIAVLKIFTKFLWNHLQLIHFIAKLKPLATTLLKTNAREGDFHELSHFPQRSFCTENLFLKVLRIFIYFQFIWRWELHFWHLEMRLAFHEE